MVQICSKDFVLACVCVCVCAPVEFWAKEWKTVCEFDTIVLNCLDVNQRTIYC